MRTDQNARLNLAGWIWPILVALLLVAYTFVRFFLIPYVGFQFNSSSGEIVDVYTANPAQPAPQSGDKLISIGGNSFEDYRSRLGVNILEGLTAGESVPLTTQAADGEVRTLRWMIPGFNTGEFGSRLLNTWVMSYVFWFAGTATFFLVRPKDLRWRLLVAFYYVTAVWVIAGSISYSTLWGSQFLMRAALWLALPVYVQLHLTFPRNPAPRFPKAWLGFYAACVLLAGLQLAGWLPPSLPLLAFGLGVAASALILLIRIVADKASRRELLLLAGAFLFAFLPTLLLVAAFSSGLGLPTEYSGSILFLIAIPGAYFYVVYRRQPGGAELRANRAISLYFFLSLLATVVLLLVPLFAGYFVSFVAAGAVVLVAGLTIALISVFGFAPFQRLIERWVLRIPEAPDHLVAAFAGRLSTSFTQEHLVDLLQKEVLPSLLIRQSTLISLGEGRPDVVYLQGLKRSQLPPRRQQQAILETSSAAPEGVAAFPEHAWLRLAVPLKVAQEPLGLWLLGRKDPDDLYTHSEQSLLRSLADQMAIALANISQAHNLRSLYQRDIERQEEERVHLARELHDDILNDMNLLLTEATQAVDSKEFSKKHLALDDRVRRLIHGLRPPMLNYGLVHAFSQLADELRAKSSEVEIRLSFNSNEESYEKKVQEHIYRVVQQAAENALEHGKAQLISISGTLQPNAIDILVEDDGAGFRLKGNDLAHLLETKHFGLAGMSERAALIGARLQIHSSPRRGTRVSLTWRQKD